MQTYIENQTIKSLLALAVMSLFLAACDSQKSNKPAIKMPVQSYKQAITLEGVVMDENGPVLEGEVKVADSSGRIVATTQLNNSKHYSVEVPAGTELPVVLSIRVKGMAEPLKAVGVSAAVSSYDITLLTTTIAKRAKELGGYTYSNMVLAADSTVGVPDANKTTTGFRGDPTKQYGGWH
nr:hypothetical protein [Methylomarinum sp. Ch1-1]MDP4520911.1 hypothetical protein [Methylomarinum sp. Ch1-1]